MLPCKAPSAICIYCSIGRYSLTFFLHEGVKAASTTGLAPSRPVKLIWLLCASDRLRVMDRVRMPATMPCGEASWSQMPKGHLVRIKRAIHIVLIPANICTKSRFNPHKGLAASRATLNSQKAHAKPGDGAACHCLRHVSFCKLVFNALKVGLRSMLSTPNCHHTICCKLFIELHVPSHLDVQASSCQCAPPCPYLCRSHFYIAHLWAIMPSNICCTVACLVFVTDLCS